jgi:hypothetical protein
MTNAFNRGNRRVGKGAVRAVPTIFATNVRMVGTALRAVAHPANSKRQQPDPMRINSVPERFGAVLPLIEYLLTVACRSMI